MSDWLPQRRQVVRPADNRTWRTKKNGEYVSAAQQATSKKKAKANAAAQERTRLRQQRHAAGEPCGISGCQQPVCVEARQRKREAKAAAKAKRRAEQHAKGEPCGAGNCEVEVCAQAHKAKQQAKKATKSPGSRRKSGAARSASSATRAQRTAELHGKGLPCGQDGCKNSTCRKARQPKGRAATQQNMPKQAKALPMGPTGNKSGTDLAIERARAKHHQKKSPQDVQPQVEKTGTSKSANPTKAAKAKASPVKDSSGSRSTTSKPAETMQCRECLRVKPVSSFPDPSRRRCEDCGGQPRSRSVRTVSGGAPGLGRRR